MPPSFPFHMTVFFQFKPDYLPILQQEIFITTIVLHYDQCLIFFYSLFVLTPQQSISITAKYRHLKNSVLIYAKLSCLKIKPSSNKKCRKSLNCRGKGHYDWSDRRLAKRHKSPFSPEDQGQSIRTSRHPLLCTNRNCTLTGRNGHLIC